ncbi:MAG TPA: DUF1326 domain-containing protein [Pyrinomonadaceae bacterium]|nr:DUF1326 domain-containing protein [Pyrinomonadaceae bacterium]
MRNLKTYYVIAAGLLLLALVATTPSQMTSKDQPAAAANGEWDFNATIIEACSCPMFCQCYFNMKPASHHGHAGGGGEHFCKFNNAFKVNKGQSGGVKLDGAKFWVAGDLGGDFSKGQMDWAVLTFDPSVSKEQRDAIARILGHVYPVKWNSFTVAKDADMEWKAEPRSAHARLGGGKVAEVILRHPDGSAMADGPVVIKNLKYFGVPRNDGFIMMPNEVEAYRQGDKAFEYKGTNGFMITIDIASRDVKGK